MGIMDSKTAEDRFFQSLKVWAEPTSQRHEKVLDAGTDVDGAVDRMFDTLLGRTSIPPS